MYKFILAFMFVLLLFPGISLGQDLTDERIISNYKTYMAEPDNEECMKLIEPTNIEVVEKNFEEKFCTVKLIVTCNWIGESGKRFYQGPCFGFSKTRGKGQSIPKVMYYQLSADKWVLTGLR